MVFFGGKNFRIYCFLGVFMVLVFGGGGYSKYWYFYGVTLIKMHILTYFLGFIFSKGIFLGAFENFVIFWGEIYFL